MSWQALSTRVASFTAPPKPAGARPTRGHQKTSWPHPPSFRANPATLAEAGFYYAPSSSDLDNVVCFMCAKELSDWEAEDDPFQIHAVKCPKCPWVVVRCALAQDLDDEGNYNFPTPDRLPNSRVLERARLATYTKGKEKIWPHDGTKNHGAMSKKMAKAGFVYTPSSTPDDDTATCLYCNTSLSGWDAEDDPLQEHIRRPAARKCAFVLSLSKSKAEPPDSKPASEVEAEPPKPEKRKTRSKAPPVSMPQLPAKSKAPASKASSSGAKTKKKKKAKPVDPDPSDAVPVPEDTEAAIEDEVARSIREALTVEKLPDLRPIALPTASKPNGQPPMTLLPPISPQPPTPPPPPPPNIDEEDSSQLPVFPLADPERVETSVLTEEERKMTVEQWIRHEMDRQYEILKVDGERRIDEFLERAAEVRRQIELL